MKIKTLNETDTHRRGRIMFRYALFPRKFTIATQVEVKDLYLSTSKKYQNQYYKK